MRTHDLVSLAIIVVGVMSPLPHSDAFGGGQTDLTQGDPPVSCYTCPAGRIIPQTPGEAPYLSMRAGDLSSTFVLTGLLPEGDTPAAAVFTPDGSKIVVAHRDTQNLVIFDAATRTVFQVMALSGSPNDVAISISGLYAVTANVFEDTASIVDLTTGQEQAVVAVGAQPSAYSATVRLSSMLILR